jgi:hypothetical protein
LLAASIDDKNVESAKALDGLIDELAAPVLVRNVARQRDRLAALCLDQGDDRLCVLLFAWKIGDGDIGALARIGDSGSSADAAVAASDQRLAALELARAGIALLAMVRPGIHVRGDAGNRLRLLWKWGLGILCARVLHGETLCHVRSLLMGMKDDSPVCRSRRHGKLRAAEPSSSTPGSAGWQSSSKL